MMIPTTPASSDRVAVALEQADRWTSQYHLTDYWPEAIALREIARRYLRGELSQSEPLPPIEQEPPPANLPKGQTLAVASAHLWLRKTLEIRFARPASDPFPPTSLCPVCGYAGLDEPPYDEFDHPSNKICPSCGTEFGYHDGVRDASLRSEAHLRLRRQWVDGGMKWWDSGSGAPPGWDGVEQLRRAALMM